MRTKFSLLSRVAFAVFLIAIAAGVVAIWAKSSEKNRFLRMAPAGLGVSQVLYAREESWGFGPGGNESGVIMFELPVDVARAIERQGIAFLDQCASARGLVRGASASRTAYQWKATPVPIEGSDDSTNSTQSYNIDEYLNRYGFGLPIDKKLARNINDALSSQGNFVDDNGRRLIIIMPKAAKLVVAYRG